MLDGGFKVTVLTEWGIHRETVKSFYLLIMYCKSIFYKDKLGIVGIKVYIWGNKRGN